MREAKVFIVVGGRGTGKTYFLEHALKKNKAVIVELVKTDRYGGFNNRIFYEDFENGNVNLKHLANKQIVFEDATSYISSNMKDSLRRLIVFSKQIKSDVFVVFHGVNVVPPFMWNLFNYLILFNCAEARETGTNREYITKIKDAQRKLQKMKQYSYITIESNI